MHLTLPGGIAFCCSAIVAARIHAQPCGWSALDGGLTASATAATVHDDGTGLAVYVGGPFHGAVDGELLNGVGRWNGTSWTAVGDGLPLPKDDRVRVLASVDLGSGPLLYAGGTFNGDGLVRIAAWDGAAWTSPGPGLNERVRSIVGYAEDGAAPALYAAGQFTATADGSVELLRIGRWDGAEWTPVGGGLEGAIARDLAVFDEDGAGPALPSLFVLGDISAAGGTPVNNIARWDGSQWSDVGGGLTGGGSAPGICLKVWDDGTGPALYAGGGFLFAGGLPAARVARWNGVVWSPLGDGIEGTWVRDLEVANDGRGPALFAGGTFTQAGGQTAKGVARWDGTSWSSLGTGVSYYAVALAPSAHGQGLIVGGDYTNAGGQPGTKNVAEWACPCAADCTLDGAVDLSDFFCFVGQFNAGDAAADCDQSGGLDLFDLLCFVQAFNDGCP